MEQLSFGNTNGKSRADQIFERFVVFHKANPHVYSLFCEIADDMRQYQDQYSARTIIEVIRWRIDSTVGSDPVKLNDHYSPYYARMYMATHPGSEDFFELRRRTSADRTAYKEDMVMYHTGAAINEEQLIEKLKELAEDEHSG